MKIACYFLFHLIDVYTYSTRQNNNWIYKNGPIQKFTYESKKLTYEHNYISKMNLSGDLGPYLSSL